MDREGIQGEREKDGMQQSTAGWSHTPLTFSHVAFVHEGHETAVKPN